jgi:hypothetical protein
VTGEGEVTGFTSQACDPGAEAAAAEAMISRSRIVLGVRDPSLFIAPPVSDSFRAAVERNWKITFYCEVPVLWG